MGPGVVLAPFDQICAAGSILVSQQIKGLIQHSLTLPVQVSGSGAKEHARSGALMADGQLRDRR
jgi:hypothetical protein